MFTEKAIFVWNNPTIGDAARIVALVKEARFEAVHLHSTNVDNWRTASRVALANAAKAAGLKVYASVAVYGENPSREGAGSGAIVNQYGLDGIIFDAEKGSIETAADADARARTILRTYQDMTARPAAWCWWPFHRNWVKPFQPYHPRRVLEAAMESCAVGMPMAYWNWGDDAASAVRYLEEVWKQWREVTAKPLVLAGRACVGDGGRARPEAVKAFEARGRQLGAVGFTWWSMEHALDGTNLPGVWQALKETPTMKEQGNPMPENLYKKMPMLGVMQDDQWTNPGFAGYVAFGAESWHQPNQNLKAIEKRAKAEGRPMILAYEYNVDFYARMQYPLKRELWPPHEKDEPFQNLRQMLADRTYQAVVVKVVDPTNHDGKTMDPDWISLSARWFMERVEGWLNQNRPGVPLLLGTSHDFIKTFAPGVADWAHLYRGYIVQDAVPLLDESFPQGGDKPLHLGASKDWCMWEYRPRLVIYNGTREGLYQWLKMGQTPPPPPPPPPPADADLTARVVKLEAEVAHLKTQVEVLTNWARAIGLD